MLALCCLFVFVIVVVSPVFGVCWDCAFGLLQVVSLVAVPGVRLFIGFDLSFGVIQLCRFGVGLLLFGLALGLGFGHILLCSFVLMVYGCMVVLVFEVFGF